MRLLDPGLLLFRSWGFAGDTARFRAVPSSVAALQHLAHLRREPDTEIGHNAAGGWMVLVGWRCFAVQVGTGLPSDDALAGPLFRYVGKDRSDWLSASTTQLPLTGSHWHICRHLTYAVLEAATW